MGLPIAGVIDFEEAGLDRRHLMETPSDLTKMKIVMRAPGREDVSCSDASEQWLRLLDVEVVGGDGPQPVRFSSTNGLELAEHGLKVSLAITAFFCRGIRVDLWPFRIRRFEGHSESRAEVIEILIGEMADDLQNGPIGFGRTPASVIETQVGEKRRQRVRDAFEPVDHPVDVHAPN